MRITTLRPALAIAGSLALAGATVAAESRGGERRASSAGSSVGSTAVSRPSSGSAPATTAAPRASAPAVRATAPASVPRASAPAVRATAPLRGAAADAPRRFASDQSPRTAPAGSTPVGTAVSRGGDSGGGSWGGGGNTTSAPSSPGGTETIQSTSGGRDRGSSRSSGRSATSRGGRSRGDHTAIGTATDRTHPPNNGGGGWGGGCCWDPDYWWGYGGVGLGYFYYDPYWWGPGWGDPYGYGMFGGGGGDGGYTSSVRRDAIGQLRLKMKPKEAQVYVDGALAGTVDDFDGTFERLDLVEGPHRIEVRLDGRTPRTFDVNIVADELTTLRGRID
jgi:hypothetical protein